MIFGANWKSNPVGEKGITSLESAIQLLDGYAKRGLSGLTDRTVIIYPPSILIPGISSYVQEKGYGFKLGSQDVSHYDSGAYTGQIPIQMFMDFGVREFLIAHSERRDSYESVALEVSKQTISSMEGVGSHVSKDIKKKIENESFIPTNDMYNRKILVVLGEENTTATYCVGETLDEKENRRTNEVLLTQLQIGLRGINARYYNRIRVAYEPRWAIGGERLPSNEEIFGVHNKIKEIVGTDVPILYGGGTSPENIAGIMSIPNVNGVLVGGASLDAEKFASIVLFDKK